MIADAKLAEVQRRCNSIAGGREVGTGQEDHQDARRKLRKWSLSL